MAIHRETSGTNNFPLEFNSPRSFLCELDSIAGACSVEMHKTRRLHRVGANYKRRYIHYPLKGRRFLPTVLQSTLRRADTLFVSFPLFIFATILPRTQPVAFETFRAVTFRILSYGKGFLTGKINGRTATRSLLIERSTSIVRRGEKVRPDTKCHGSVVSNMLEITIGNDSRRMKSEILHACRFRCMNTISAMFLAAKRFLDNILLGCIPLYLSRW